MRCIGVFAIALVIFPLTAAIAGGRSAESNGRVGGSLDSSSGVTTLGGAEASVTSSVGTPDSQTSQGEPSGGDAAGTYGQLGVSHTTPLTNSLDLQFNSSVDLEDQKSGDGPGSLNGRVGLGWKY
ncbi:MAG: hypothetical protein JSR89_06755 [Proteobacteria bacterium]|nr:hypothetical protein [Pseudomonadota bacterium]